MAKLENKTEDEISKIEKTKLFRFFSIIHLPLVLCTYAIIYWLPFVEKFFSLNNWAIYSLLCIGQMGAVFYFINKFLNFKFRLKYINDLFDIICIVQLFIPIILLFGLVPKVNLIFYFAISFLEFIVFSLAYLLNENKKINVIHKEINQKFSKNILQDLLSIKGTSYIKRETDSLVKIDKRTDNKDTPENLRHVAYKYLHDINYSLYELAEMDISKKKYPSNLKSSFSFAIQKLIEFEENSNGFAWYVNLGRPDIWINNEFWNQNYFIPFLKAIKNKNIASCDIRRIHIVLENDFHKYYNNIFGTLLTERLFGVNNKVLIISNDELRNDFDNVFEILSDIILLDYAILFRQGDSYYSNPDNKLVLCSDILPYSKQDIDQKKKVYVIKDYYSFKLFYEHFMCMWNLNDFLKIKCKVYAETSIIKSKIIDFSEIVNDDLFNQNFSDIDFKEIVGNFIDMVWKEKFPDKNRRWKKLEESVKKLILELSGLKKNGVEFNAEFEEKFKEIQVKKINKIQYEY